MINCYKCYLRSGVVSAFNAVVHVIRALRMLLAKVFPQLVHRGRLELAVLASHSHCVACRFVDPQPVGVRRLELALVAVVVPPHHSVSAGTLSLDLNLLPAHRHSLLARHFQPQLELSSCEFLRLVVFFRGGR